MFYVFFVDYVCWVNLVFGWIIVRISYNIGMNIWYLFFGEVVIFNSLFYGYVSVSGCIIYEVYYFMVDMFVEIDIDVVLYLVMYVYFCKFFGKGNIRFVCFEWGGNLFLIYVDIGYNI